MKTKKIKTIIIKSLIIVSIFAIIAVSVYFLLKSLGFTTTEDFLRLRDELGDSFLFWLVIGLLQIIQVIFIPISNQLITGSLALIFPIEELWKVFLVSWLSIWLSTLILYAIGRFGGLKVFKWLVESDEKVEKYTNFINRGKMFYPLGCLAPIIPDDLITILAGAGKMNFWFVVVSAFITRAIDVACSVWGFGILGKIWYGWLIIGIAYLGLIIFSIWYFKKHNTNNIQKKGE